MKRIHPPDLVTRRFMVIASINTASA
jgi:hypothetical protein